MDHHRSSDSPTSPRIADFPLAVAVGLTTLLALTTGCDALLDVDENPNTVPGEELNNPTSLEARLVGAEADFFFSYDMASVWSGLFADELAAGAFEEVDERRVTTDNGTIGAADEVEEGFDGLWTPLQKAAFTTNLLQEDILADNFPDRIPDPENSAELARVSMLAGYAKLTLGEIFCTTAFDGDGPEHTSQETFALAEEEFSLAIDASDATQDVRRASLVGRARARLHMGDTQGALADAEQVPLDWDFVAAVYSTNSAKEENDIWNMLSDSRRFTTDPAYRFLDIDDTSEDDPRIEAFQDPSIPLTTDGSAELYQLDKYRVPTAPIRLASGFEAQYYVAEIQGGQQAVDIINDVRDAIGSGGDDGDGRGQGDLAAQDFDSSDEQEIRLKLFDERARTLFMEGKRLGDLRRYLDRFDLDLFPSSPVQDPQTCFPLPDAERDNNPDI